MNYTIDKSSTKFLRGLFSCNELKSWQSTEVINGGICFCGRSNVGKSSLINALWGNKTAKTSKNPGKTQGIMVFTFILKNHTETRGPFYLFDLPGYGTAKVSKEIKNVWKRLMETFFDQLDSKVMIVHVRDARHPMEELDRVFENFVSELMQKKVLIFNKMDKLKGQKEKLLFHKFLQAHIDRENYCVSTKNLEGINAFKKALMNFLIDLRYRQ